MDAAEKYKTGSDKMNDKSVEIAINYVASTFRAAALRMVDGGPFPPFGDGMEAAAHYMHHLSLLNSAAFVAYSKQKDSPLFNRLIATHIAMGEVREERGLSGRHTRLVEKMLQIGDAAALQKYVEYFHYSYALRKRPEVPLCAKEKALRKADKILQQTYEV